MKVKIAITAVLAAALIFTLTSLTMEKGNKTNAYLQITLSIDDADRGAAAGVFVKYKPPFLKDIKGATSKELLLRTDDVQVLHGFETEAEANAYLTSALFEQDVVRELKPYLKATPEIRVYSVFSN